MRRLGTMRARWRGAALLPVAVLMVHQLRYVLAFGSHYERELSSRGDSYTAWLTPVCGVLLALVLGAVVGRVAEACRTGLAGRSPRLTWRALWCALTLTLVVCFCVQEWLEILLEPSHAGTLTGIFASGGWTALPAAAAVAAVLVTLVRGARVALAAIARWSRAPRDGRGGGIAPRRPRGLQVLVLTTPLARCCAGRAPPRMATSA
jgi:hypothetical protein